MRRSPVNLVKPIAALGLVTFLLHGFAFARPVEVETEAWRSLDDDRSSVSVVAGDVDLDGDLDLVYSSSDGKVALYSNNFGRLSSRVPIWESSVELAPITKAVLGDINGDGFPELVCALESAPLVVFWNSGGIFSSQPESIGQALPVSDLALADLDNDQDLDLILACDGAANRWLPNENGTLQENAVIIGIADDTKALAVGDIDADGWLDVFMANHSGNGVNQVLFNRGGDLTADVVDVRESGTPRNAALGDITGDGLLDMVISDVSQVIKTFINNGDLTFTSGPADIPAGVVTDLALADLDGDGLLDVACTTVARTAPVKWVRNQGGSWAETEVLGSLDVGGGATALALGDYDEDGDLDIAGATGAGHPEAILWLVGGILESKASWPPPGSFAAGDTSTTYGLALVDLDKDNDLDVVQARRDGGGSDRNAIYINQDGVIASAPDQWTAVETVANSLHVTDWDRDGFPDVLFGNHSLPVHLHRNINGTLDPNPENLGAQAAPVWSLAAVDLDNDGHDDLVEGGTGDLRVSLRNVSGEGFRETLVLGADLPGNFFNYLDFADVDHDGDLDFAAALAPGLDVVFRNNFNHELPGAPVDTMWISPASHSGGFVSLKDIDSDGQSDLTFGYAGGAVENEWFLGSSGGFDPLGRRWGSNVYQTWQVEMSDWDGDGYEDLLEAEYLGPNLLMRNRVGNIDQPDRPMWVAEDSTGTFRLAAGDLDNDGDLDLWVGNKSGQDQIFRGVINPGPTNPEGIARPEMPGSPAYLQRLSAGLGEANGVVVSFEAVDRQGDQMYILGRCRPVSSPNWFEVESSLVNTSQAGEPHQLVLNSVAWPASSEGYILQLRSVEISHRLPVVGYAPRYEVRLPAAGILRPESILSTREVMMPTVTEGGSSSATMQITNTGNDNLQIEGEASRGDLILLPASATVSPGESLTMRLEIFPTDTVQHRQVVFSSNDPLSPADTVMVTTDIRALDFDFNFLLEGRADTAPLGESLTGLLAPSDGVTMEEGWLHYRQKGSTSFTVLPMSSLDNDKDWVAVIPGDQVTNSGIEYYLEVRNGGKTVTDRAVDPGSDPYLLKVEQPNRMTSLVQAHSDAGILAGRDVFVRIVPPPGAVLSERVIHYRMGGEVEFQMVTLQKDSTTALIPAAAVGERGLEYHVEARSLFTVLRDPPAGENQVRVNVQDLSEPHAAGPSQYRMVSVPLDFGDFPGTIGDLLTDQPEFGPYDITNWRCFRHLTDDNRYGELAHADLAAEFKPAPGKAFWLIGVESNRLRTAPVTGRSVPLDQPYAVTVPPKGWTQVGNPFSFPVSWDGVFVTDESGAAADELLVGPIAGNHSELTVLEPFGGFWVNNLHDENLVIHFRPQAHVEEKGSGSGANPWDWSVTLDASSKEAGSASAKVAATPTSRSNWDVLDTPLPPSAPDQRLRVYLTNGSWPLHGGPYVRDVRPEAGQGQTWSFDIDLVSAGVGEVLEAEVTFGNLSSLPDNKSAVLFDRELHQVVPLVHGTRYSLLVKGSRASAEAGRFMLAIGTQEFLDQAADELTPLPPVKTVLMPNAPNPFNPATVIHYELAITGLVRLNVYDVRGQRVRELVAQSQAAGRYRVMWDGRDNHGAGAGAGVYFARLETQGGSAQTIKMILVK